MAGRQARRRNPALHGGEQTAVCCNRVVMPVNMSWRRGILGARLPAWLQFEQLVKYPQVPSHLA